MRADLIIKYAGFNPGTAQILHNATRRQAIAAFNIGNRACDILIRHWNAPAAEFLDAQPLINQQAQYLVPALGARITGNPCGKRQQAPAAFDFAAGDNIAIHHSDDAIHVATSGLRHSSGYGACRQQQGGQ